MAIKTFTKEYYVTSDGTKFEDIQQAKEYEEIFKEICEAYSSLKN